MSLPQRGLPDHWIWSSRNSTPLPSSPSPWGISHLTLYIHSAVSLITVCLPAQVRFMRTGASSCSSLQTQDQAWCLPHRKHSSGQWMSQSTGPLVIRTDRPSWGDSTHFPVKGHQECGSMSITLTNTLLFLLLLLPLLLVIIMWPSSF